MKDQEHQSSDRLILLVFGSLVFCLFLAILGFVYLSFNLFQESELTFEEPAIAESTHQIQITGTPVPSPHPTTQSENNQLKVPLSWPLINFEDFNNIGNIWPIDENFHPQFEYQRDVIDGKYVIEVRSDKERNFATVQTEFETNKIFYFSTEVEQISGADDIPFGIIIESNENASENIAFLITNSGNFYAYHKDYSYTLVPWQSSPYLIPGEVNKLAIVSQIGSIKIFINDHFITEATIFTRKGYVGFFIVYPGGTENAVFAFDNFELRIP